jgi:hypothetical protein
MKYPVAGSTYGEGQMKNASKFRLIPAIVLIGGLSFSAAQAAEDQDTPFSIQRATAVLQQAEQTERKLVRRKKRNRERQDSILANIKG